MTIHSGRYAHLPAQLLNYHSLDHNTFSHMGGKKKRSSKKKILTFLFFPLLLLLFQFHGSV